MAAAKLPLLIEQGATFLKHVQLSTGGPVSEGGTPISLVGAEVRMHIRKSYRTTDAYFELSSTGSVADTTDIYVTAAATGEFDITITATDTTAIDWTAAVYDLEVEYSNGVVRRYLYGPVKVTKEATRETP